MLMLTLHWWIWDALKPGLHSSSSCSLFRLASILSSSSSWCNCKLSSKWELRSLESTFVSSSSFCYQKVIVSCFPSNLNVKVAMTKIKSVTEEFDATRNVVEIKANKRSTLWTLMPLKVMLNPQRNCLVTMVHDTNLFCFLQSARMPSIAVELHQWQSINQGCSESTQLVIFLW